MRVYGVDFTSAPGGSKSICVAACRLDGDRLTFRLLDHLRSWGSFEAALRLPGPWIAGFDFPFTQSRKFLRNIDWPKDWPNYVRLIRTMSRERFRDELRAYKAPREKGDKEHSRDFEPGTGAVSPQKLDRVPVALMQFEGVPRLLAAGLQVPGLAEGDPRRVAVEAYPGVAARALIGSSSYKSEEKTRQTPELHEARRLILARLCGEEGRARFGLRVEAPDWLADDPGADPLDALLCAAQAAWAHRLLTGEPGRLAARDLSGGWIADPDVVARLPRRSL